MLCLRNKSHFIEQGIKSSLRYEFWALVIWWNLTCVTNQTVIGTCLHYFGALSLSFFFQSKIRDRVVETEWFAIRKNQTNKKPVPELCAYLTRLYFDRMLGSYSTNRCKGSPEWCSARRRVTKRVAEITSIVTGE